jgi:hypothetical protein
MKQAKKLLKSEIKTIQKFKQKIKQLRKDRMQINRMIWRKQEFDKSSYYPTTRLKNLFNHRSDISEEINSIRFIYYL